MCKRFSQNPIKDIYAKVVREGDFFEEEIDGGVQNIKYRPRPFSNEPMIGAFAVVVFKDGSMMYDSMSKDDIENVRNVYSKAKDSQAWKSSTGEMYKKTVLRRLCKLIDLNFDNVEQRQAFYAGGDVEFENGQPVYLDDRKDDAAALPDKGVPVNVFAQQQAYREPVPAEESKAPQNSQEEDFKQFEQQYMDQQAAQQPDNSGFMEMDDAMLSGLPWK